MKFPKQQPATDVFVMFPERPSEQLMENNIFHNVYIYTYEDSRIRIIIKTSIGSNFFFHQIQYNKISQEPRAGEGGAGVIRNLECEKVNKT